MIVPPEHVKIIGSSSTEENQEIFLTCSTSTSNPPVMLRWWLGWRELNATEIAISEVGNIKSLKDHEAGGMISLVDLTHLEAHFFLDTGDGSRTVLAQNKALKEQNGYIDTLFSFLANNNH